MRKLVVIGAAVLLALAIAVPLATAATTTAPKTVTGSFIGTYTGPGSDPENPFRIAFRFEVRTDASGAVLFGYYQTQPLGSPDLSTVAVVESARFFRTAAGTRAAELRMTECNVATGGCSDQAVATVTDGPDTFCGGDTCQYPYRIDDGNIVISGTSGQNGQ